MSEKFGPTQFAPEYSIAHKSCIGDFCYSTYSDGLKKGETIRKCLTNASLVWWEVGVEFAGGILSHSSNSSVWPSLVQQYARLGATFFAVEWPCRKREYSLLRSMRGVGSGMLKTTSTSGNFWKTRGTMNPHTLQV